MFGVQLAGFTRVMGGVGGMARGDVGVMAGGFRIARFVVGRSFAVVLGGLFMVVGGLSVVFVRVMGRNHVNVLSGLGEKSTNPLRNRA